MIREEEEEECKTKDQIRKFHFNSDHSVAMMNMHQEATEKDTNPKEQLNLVSLASGAGGKPVDIFFDKDWDIKAPPPNQRVQVA